MAASVQAVERAAQILRLLAGSRRLGLADIASELQLPKTTVHGLVRALVSSGLVRQDPDTDKYQLGAALLHLGSSYLRSDQLRLGAVKWAESLALEARQVVRVGAPHDGGVLIVHHVPRPNDNLQTSDLGSLLPIHASALGKVLLAGDEQARSALADSELTAYTRQTITNLTSLERQLAKVRQQGWAVASQELTEGQAELACPITDRCQVVGAIGVVGPIEELIAGASPHHEVLDRVRSAARAISQVMGGGTW